MSDFEQFINNLSPEQMQLLQAALNKASDNRPVAKIPIKELPTRNETNKEEVVSSNPRAVVKEDFTVVRDESLDQRKTPVKGRKNQWQDEGEFKDTEFDYQKFERMKTPRKRTKPNKKTVECHVCGKTFTMNENLIFGEYIRCNRCTGR